MTGDRVRASHPVVLCDYDPAWPRRAADLSAPIRHALGGALIDIHHIGSTAVPGLAAKPVIDLIPIVRDLEELDRLRPRLESLGYRWRGENGLPGRHYFTLDDAEGARAAHLHAYEAGHPDIARHLAFRDWLRVHPGEARAYAVEKRRARDLHPGDSWAYSGEKSAWVRAAEGRALDWFARDRTVRHTGGD